MTRKKTERKQLPALTWEQVERLALGIAQDLGQDRESAASLMILMYEISENSFDGSRVEGIASSLVKHLFVQSATEYDEAEVSYIESQRQTILTMIDGGVQ